MVIKTKRDVRGRGDVFSDPSAEIKFHQGGERWSRNTDLFPGLGLLCNTVRRGEIKRREKRSE